MPDERKLKQLQKALLSAFPTQASLEQMVRLELNENLHTIAHGNLSEVMFGLITWAESQGRLDELLIAAKSANPTNALLNALAPEVLMGTKWKLPHERNVFFTGREKELQLLRDAFASHKNVACIHALHGLGGIGKTQCAVEYAFRCYEGAAGYPSYDYILWTKADTAADLLADYTRIAPLLSITLSNPDDQQEVAAEVKQWLETHSNWLLIFDNADDPDLLEPFRPKNTNGHILLTSRVYRFKGNLGITHPIELRSLLPEDALAFLFHRTGRTMEQEPDSERNVAAELAQHLGYFPLALEQAAAYIAAEEITFASYLDDFRKREIELLHEAPPETGEYYSANTQEYKTVRTTWDFNFRAIEKDNPATADLLRFGAFLAPDDIPMRLIIEGAKTFTSPLADVFANLQEETDYIRAYDALLKPLLRYSLIEKKRNDQTFNIHRMVQSVQRDRLGHDQNDWAEKVVQVLWSTFPNPEFGNWDWCSVLLSHAQYCLQQALKWQLDPLNTALLSMRCGFYLMERGLYSAGEPLFKLGLELRQQALPAEHPDIANSLNNLATLYNSQGRYREAEPLFNQALKIRRKALPNGHPDIANTLNNLAALCDIQGRYAEAETLYKQALDIQQAAMPVRHTEIAGTLNNLSNLYNSQGRYVEAEALIKRALELLQKVLSAGHPDIANSLINLAGVYDNQGRYEEAEPLFKQALEIQQVALPESHPDIATTLNNLAGLSMHRGQWADAELTFKQVLKLRQSALRAGHPDIARILNNLAFVYNNLGRYEEAEPLHKQALEMQQAALPAGHPEIATTLNNLALAYSDQGRYVEAEVIYKQVLEMQKVALPAGHPHFAGSLSNLAIMYSNQGRYEEAEPLHKQALEMQQTALPAGHPEIANSFNNLAAQYRKQGRYEEAEPLIKHAVMIMLQGSGIRHPSTQMMLNNFLIFLLEQGQREEAEEFARSIGISIRL